MTDNLNDNPETEAIIRQAAKDQPLGTCSTCHAENVPVFLGHSIGPNPENKPPPSICADCFLKMATEIKVPRRKPHGVHVPKFIGFFLQNTRVLQTLFTAFLALVCSLVCVLYLVATNYPFAILSALVGWLVVFLNNTCIDRWRKED